MKEPIVRLNNISKVFEGLVAVDAVSLDVRPGEFLTLLGPSGCGKTTVLRLIAGFEDPTRGDIFLNGVRVNGIPANKRDTNTVFQSYALFPHMTVFDNIAFGLKIRKYDRKTIDEKVREALELVNRLLMSFHHIVPKCPAKKTCELIRIAKFLGMRLKARSLPLLLKENGTDRNHPIFDIHLNRCVLCKKCINICRIRHGWSQWIFAKRGFDMVVCYYGQNDAAGLPCSDCLACMEICPVGAITLKSL